MAAPTNAWQVVKRIRSGEIRPLLRLIGAIIAVILLGLVMLTATVASAHSPEVIIAGMNCTWHRIGGTHG